MEVSVESLRRAGKAVMALRGVWASVGILNKGKDDRERSRTKGREWWMGDEIEEGESGMMQFAVLP